MGAFELEAAIFRPGIIFADFLARVNIHFGAQTTLAAFAPVVDIVINVAIVVVVVVVVVVGTKNERNESGPVMKWWIIQDKPSFNPSLHGNLSRWLQSRLDDDDDADDDDDVERMRQKIWQAK